ncbi:MAG: shikimate dehydrogenase [Candidatus Hydrogenedentes bacterium]|jgi:shikimate dehydrogenase|nr:shikimate dehydrogenase [Candidatus Hydrogenedentota bacterium]
MIDADTRLCAVIGHPVGHSLSPAIHNAAYEALDLNFAYLAFRVEDVGAFLAGMKSVATFRGASVTLPHKLAVIEHLDFIDPMAEKVGSVNTITHEDGRLIGSTTDGPGTLRAFEEAGVNLAGKRVLFLGAGGAVRAVAFAVAEVGSPGRITLLGRNPERVAPLADDLRAKTSVPVAQGSLAVDVEEGLEEHDIIIQGTPVGMAPGCEGETCVPADALRPDHVVFDMVYKPLKTRLVQDAEEAGCAVISGLEMLIQQGALQFERWTGQRAPVEAMRRAALDALER